MAMTNDERRILEELESELARVSARPRRSHVLASCAAHWPFAVAAAGALIALTLLAALITTRLNVVLAVIAGLTAACIAIAFWRDATHRAAGD